jgi:hypothetical protein
MIHFPFRNDGGEAVCISCKSVSEKVISEKGQVTSQSPAGGGPPAMVRCKSVWYRVYAYLPAPRKNRRGSGIHLTANPDARMIGTQLLGCGRNSKAGMIMSHTKPQSHEGLLKQQITPIRRIFVPFVPLVVQEGRLFPQRSSLWSSCLRVRTLFGCGRRPRSVLRGEDACKTKPIGGGLSEC